MRWDLAGRVNAWNSPFGFWLSFQGMALLFGLLYIVQARMLRDKPEYAAIGRWIFVGILGFLALLMASVFGFAWYLAHIGPIAPGVVGVIAGLLNLAFLFLGWNYAPRMFSGEPGNAAITRQILLATGLFFLFILSVSVVNVCLGQTGGGLLGGSALAFSGIGWLFVVIGNLMPKLKSNPWAGIRVRWTMEDPEIWYRTHRMAGRLWIAGGLVLAIAPLLLPFRTVLVIFWPDIALLSLIPVFYAWHLARRKRFIAAVPPGGTDR